MAARWQDHILGPAAEVDRPDTAAAPIGALFQNSTTGDLEINDPDDGWIVYRAAAPGGGLTDPTTTKGDILVRGSSSVGRHGVGADRTILVADSAQTDGVKWAAIPCEYAVACGDETTAITTGTKVTFRMPFAMTLTEVRASLTTASSSGNPAINVKESGTTIFSTTLTIDSGEKTSKTAATPAVISDAALADDAEMTVIVDTAGTGAAGLKVTLIGTRA